MTDQEIIDLAISKLSNYGATTIKFVIRDKEYSLQEVFEDAGVRHDALATRYTSPIKWEIDEIDLGTNDLIFWQANAFDLRLKINMVSPDASTRSPAQRAFERNPKVEMKMKAVFDIIYDAIHALERNF